MAFIGETFKNFGETTSIGVCQDRKYNRHYAFVAYNTEEDAKSAYDQMNNEQVPGSEEKLYVNFAKSKRQFKEEQLQKFVQQPTNLYIKWLREEVSEEEIRIAFEQFGQTTSICVRGRDNDKTDTNLSNGMLKFAFVNFMHSEDAKQALTNGKNNELIKGLLHDEWYKNKQEFLYYAQNKSNRTSYLKAKRKKKNALQSFQHMTALIREQIKHNPQIQKQLQKFLQQQQIGQGAMGGMGAFPGMGNMQDMVAQMGGMPGMSTMAGMGGMPNSSRGSGDFNKRGSFGSMSGSGNNFGGRGGRDNMQRGGRGGSGSGRRMDNNNGFNPMAMPSLLNPALMSGMNRGQMPMGMMGMGNPSALTGMNPGMHGMGGMPNMTPMPGQGGRMGGMGANQQQGNAGPRLHKTPSTDGQNYGSDRTRFMGGNNPNSMVVRDYNWVKNNEEEFDRLSAQEKKYILGNTLYPKIEELVQDENLVPKVTGMLVDLEILPVIFFCEIKIGF